MVWIVEGPATLLVKHLERDQGIGLRLDAHLPPVLLSRRRHTPVPCTRRVGNLECGYWLLVYGLRYSRKKKVYGLGIVQPSASYSRVRECNTIGLHAAAAPNLQPVRFAGLLWLKVLFVGLL
jgi:hypothetical protein